MSAPDLSRRDVRVKHALANPVVFAEIYFAPYDPNWQTSMPLFAQEMLAFMVRSKKGVVVLPPEHMKTTLAQVYALWLTYRSAALGRMLRGMLMSEEEGMAKASLQVVTWHIENNERLAADFRMPDGKPLVRKSKTSDVWRDDAIVIERSGVSRDPTWQAKGIDSKGIHGRRLDVFIGDDLVTPRNAESPAARKSALDAMDLQIETRVVADGQMLVLANFNDEKDLPNTLARRERWQVFRRPSIHVPGDPERAPKDIELRDPAKAMPTWPENWTHERLMAEFAEKPNRFRRIHLQDPRAEHGERLHVGWLTLVEPPSIPLRYAKFYIGLDGAPGGENDDLDYFNISVLAVTAQYADLIASFDSRLPLGQQVEMLGIFHDRYQRLGYGVAAIGAPKAAMDAYLRGAIAITRPDLIAKVEPISTPGAKEIRLEGLGSFARAGWLRVASDVLHGLTSSIADRHQEISFYEQWRDFPFARHDDKLDGLDVAIRTAQEFAFIGETEFTLRVAER